MKKRTYGAYHKNYQSYGGRGITVCDDWRSNFEAFRDWAILNGYNDKLSLDRIDNDKGYSPSNCKWSTQIEQQNHRRNNRFISAFGKTMTIAQWSTEVGITYMTLWNRIVKYGLDPETALTMPISCKIKRSSIEA
jgi:hypothetical protein